MNSYEIGMLLGYLQAAKWLKKAQVIEPIVVTAKACDTFNGIKNVASLNKQDFLYGYHDAVEAAYKGEKLVTA